jgi:DNA-binding MarR family transcriptional regulator
MTAIVPESCSCSALRQASRHVTRLYDEALAPTGLGINQYAILSKLDRFGAQTLQALAERLVMDRSTLGHLLRPLETRGLATIRVGEKDRRHRLIALTPAGTALMVDARKLWIEAERRFQAAFGPGESLTLRTALKQVTTIAFDPAPLKIETGHADAY